MTVEMLVFQSDLLMLYVCGCSGQSDSCSLTLTLTHEYIRSHSQLYSHLKSLRGGTSSRDAQGVRVVCKSVSSQYGTVYITT